VSHAPKGRRTGFETTSGHGWASFKEEAKPGSAHRAIFVVAVTDERLRGDSTATANHLRGPWAAGITAQGPMASQASTSS
jgi:hypothetical protein